MNASRFKRGDRVITNAGSIGTVEHINYQWGNPRIAVKFDSSDMLSNYDEAQISFYYEDLVPNNEKPVDIGKECPKCKKSWTQTSFGNKVWLDCVPCGKTAEELIRESKKKKPEPQDLDLWGYGNGSSIL